MILIYTFFITLLNFFCIVFFLSNEWPERIMLLYVFSIIYTGLYLIYATLTEESRTKAKKTKEEEIKDLKEMQTQEIFQTLE